MRIGPAGARRYYTNSGDPGWTHKISTDIRPMLAPFLTEGQNVQNLTPIVFELPYYWKVALYRKSKTKLLRTMIWLSPYQTWGRSVAPILRTVGAMGIQKGKSRKFLIYHLFSGPRGVQCHQCYTNCWGCSCCKMTTMPYIPIRPYVSQGVTQKGKSGKFLIYPPFQRPTPSTAPPMLYHLLGP